jgi:hypothetical protein
MSVALPDTTPATAPPTTSDALPPLPDDVREFCEKHNLAEHVAATARLLRDTFPPPGEIPFRLFTDPESDEEVSWVVVKIRSAGDVPSLLQANERFLDRWIPTTPAAVRDLLNASFTFA